jgi:hypothetical protein
VPTYGGRLCRESGLHVNLRLIGKGQSVFMVLVLKLNSRLLSGVVSFGSLVNLQLLNGLDAFVVMLGSWPFLHVVALDVTLLS